MTATFLPDPEPRVRNYTIISVDDHLIEPAHCFEGRLPAALQERAPRVVTLADGRETWIYEDNFYPQVGLNAVAGRPKAEWSMEPARFDEMRRGCYDIEARVADMDLDGVHATLCFPSLIAGFAGTIFAKSKDPELGLAALRAWNDWHIDEWAGSHPGRFIPLPLCALWSPQLSAQEVRRVARKGATAIAFSQAPETFGHPSIHSGAWDPFFAACQEEDVTIAIHIASSNMVVTGDSRETPIEVASTLPCWNSLTCAAHLLWCKSLVKYPHVKIALSEGGTSWIPGFLDRMERQFHLQRWMKSDLGGLRPTEKFRRHFLACFICDPSGLLLRDRIGIDNIAYEVDYPHSD